MNRNRGLGKAIIVIALVFVFTQTVSATMAADTLLTGLDNCSSIARYQNDGGSAGWEQHDQGLPFFDFNITEGIGYFVYCTGNDVLNVTGTALTQNRTDMIYTGWNLYGWLSQTISSAASRVLDAIPLSSSIARYLNDGVIAGWEQHDSGLPFFNYTVEHGKGYFIYSTGTSNWTRGPNG